MLPCLNRASHNKWIMMLCIKIHHVSNLTKGCFIYTVEFTKLCKIRLWMSVRKDQNYSTNDTIAKNCLKDHSELIETTGVLVNSNLRWINFDTCLLTYNQD
ncbi:hypothetical protein R6Q59_033409 [Mikania micrantha]